MFLFSFKGNVQEINMRIDNIRHNIPSRREVLLTASSLAVIKQITGTPMEEFTKGIINGHASIEPLSLSDLILLGRGAYNDMHYKLARDILSYVQSMCSKNKTSEDSFDGACSSRKNFAWIAQAYGKVMQ